MLRSRVISSPNTPGRLVRKNRNGVYEDRLIAKPDASKRTTVDTVVPNFRKRVAKGEVFCNSFSSIYREFSADDNYFTTSVDSEGKWYDSHHWSNGSLLTTLVGSSPSELSLDTEQAAAKAAIDAIRNVQRTEIDAAAFVGEWGKTRNLHRSVGNALVKLAESTKNRYKGRRMRRIPLYDERGHPVLNRNGHPTFRYAHDGDEFYGAARSEKTKQMADLFLSYKMGVVPLLHDLEGAVKVLSQNKALRRTARSSEVLSKVDVAVQTVPDSGTEWKITKSYSRTLSIRYGILYEDTAVGRAVAQLGLSRPLSSAWELVPYSFVVDWFVGVGDWLDANQPSLASKTLCAWASTRDQRSLVASTSGTRNFESGGRAYTGSWSGTLTSIERLNGRNPWDVRVPTRPALGSGFNPSRCADFAALVLQKVKTRF